MKHYEKKKGKEFVKKSLKLWAGVDDDLLSYEDIDEINLPNNKLSNTFHNREEDGSYFVYTPKKTQNKKDIVKRHRRSQNKTNRQEAMKEIKDELTEEDIY